MFPTSTKPINSEGELDTRGQGLDQPKCLFSAVVDLPLFAELLRTSAMPGRAAADGEPPRPAYGLDIFVVVPAAISGAVSSRQSSSQAS